MEQSNKDSRFPKQDQPEKISGPNDENKLPSPEQPAKMNTEIKKSDRSGEEEITDERKKDHDRSGL